MSTEKKNLYVFGYGLGLLIPLIVTLHGTDHGLNIWSIIGLFIFTLVIVTKMALFKPILNSWALIVQLAALNFAWKQEFGPVALMFLGLSVVVLMITLINVDTLKPVYKQWMNVAHFIGSMITGIILSVLFYVMFGTVGILLRILRKDLLNERLEPESSSYWIKRNTHHDGRYYEKQF